MSLSYTPRSPERTQTRFSTPEPDLDDHRHQHESLPPPLDHRHEGRRRGTLASIASNERPSRATLEPPTGLAPADTVARDFEHAIVDDNKSIKSNTSTGSRRSQLSADEQWHRERRNSRSSPVVARRNTFRRAVHNRQKEMGHAGSRES